jgi:shikimate kinase
MTLSAAAGPGRQPLAKETSMHPTDDRNIYLIGPRASGKTTLGEQLAKALSRPFVDLDVLFVERFGETIAEMVTRDGWDAFRRAEALNLSEVAATPGQVVATGGGIVLMPENREILKKGLIFYLQADPETLAQRLIADLKPEQRPKLTELGFKEEIIVTLAEREPLYLSLAHAVLPDHSPEELLEYTLRAIKIFDL